MATQASKVEDALLDCRSVWKVFGERAPEAMRLRFLGRAAALGSST